MNQRRGCLWGIFQVGFVLCFTGGVILMALSQAVFQERITPGQVWYRLMATQKAARAINVDVTEEIPLSIEALATVSVAQDNVTVTAPPVSTSTSTPTANRSEIVGTTLPVQTPLPTVTALAPSSPTPQPTATALTLRILPAATETPPSFLDEAIDPAMTRLRIPKIGVDAPIVLASIVNGRWQVSHLAQTVGHLERTANPGDRGNLVLTAAERNGDGLAPFAQLGTLTPGDLVLVYYQGQAFLYHIDYLATVSAADVAVTYPSHQPKITLLTHSDNERVMAVGILASQAE